jgi:predicted dehydrogenase
MAKAMQRLPSPNPCHFSNQRFITAIRSNTPGTPDFARGAEVQKLLDACIKSDHLGKAVKI